MVKTRIQLYTLIENLTYKEVSTCISDCSETYHIRKFKWVSICISDYSETYHIRKFTWVNTCISDIAKD